MSTSMVLFEKMGLTNSLISYSECANAFLSAGFISRVGNTYYNSIRIAEGVMIKEEVGDAHYGITFLNGIKIYTIKTKTLIAEKQFSGLRYSKDTIRYYAFEMLFETLRDAHKISRVFFNERDAIRQIERVLEIAFNEDQRKVLIENTQKLLLNNR